MLQDEDMKMTMTAMKTMTTTDDDGTSKIESGAIYPQRVGKRNRGAELFTIMSMPRCGTLMQEV